MVNKTKNRIKNSWAYKYLVGVAFVLVTFFMGINYIFISITNSELPPLWSASLRYLIAGFVFLIVTIVNKISLPEGRLFWGAVIYGILAYALNTGLLYWALSYINPSVASVIYSTLPLSTLLIAGLFGIEKINLKSIICTLSVLLGIFLIFQNEFNTNTSILPLISVLVASVTTALSTVLFKKFSHSNLISVNVVAIPIAGILLSIISLLSGELISIPKQADTILSLGWLIMSTIITSTLVLWTIRKTSATAVSYRNVLSPIITILLSVLLTNQHIQPSFLVGSTIVLLSVSTSISSGKSYLVFKTV